jgi:hypothetical protein
MLANCEIHDNQCSGGLTFLSDVYEIVHFFCINDVICIRMCTGDVQKNVLSAFNENLHDESHG